MYNKLTYGYARGHEAYAYVENIRKYQISLVGYLLEKEKEAAEANQLAQSYPVVAPDELTRPTTSILPFVAFSADGAFERNHLIAPHTLVQVPTDSLHLVVHSRVSQYVHQRTGRSGFFIRAPKTSVPIRLCTIAPEHITHGSSVTYSVVSSRR